MLLAHASSGHHLRQKCCSTTSRQSFNIWCVRKCDFFFLLYSKDYFRFFPLFFNLILPRKYLYLNNSALEFNFEKFEIGTKFWGFDQSTWKWNGCSLKFHIFSFVFQSLTFFGSHPSQFIHLKTKDFFLRYSRWKVGKWVLQESVCKLFYDIPIKNINFSNKIQALEIITRNTYRPTTSTFCTTVM